MTGVEGYVESAAIGLLAGRFAAAERRGESLVPPAARRPRSVRCSRTSPAGRPAAKTFQPMNINYGLFPEIEEPQTDAEGRRIKGKERGRERKRALSRRALSDIDQWLRRVAASC